MNQKCSIENHSNKSIILICLASQCQGKRLCCSKCQAELHQHHSQDQFVAFNDLLDFINIQSQKPTVPSPKVMQELQELNIHQIINPNQSVIDQKPLLLDQKQNMKEGDQNMNDQNDKIVDPNPFSKLTKIHELKRHTRTINAIDICDQKNLLVSGSWDSTVNVWNLQNGTLLKTYQNNSVILDVVFSKQGKFIAYGGGSHITNLIEIKDLKDNDIVSELKGHKNCVSKLQFSNDQTYLISGSYDNTVRVWSVKTKQELFKLETGSAVFGLAMSRDNRLIVSHSWTTGIKIWDFKGQKVLCQHKGHSNGLGITLSNDEKQLISSGSDGKVKIWSIRELNSRKLPLIKKFKASNNYIQKVLLTSDSKFIILYCYKDGYVKVIDSNTGEQVQLFEFKNQITNSSDYTIKGVAITKKMNVVAYGEGNEIIIWRMK